MDPSADTNFRIECNNQPAVVDPTTIPPTTAGALKIWLTIGLQYEY